jgi:hypothetical protein
MPNPPASCVLLPGVNRKQLAEQAQKLEKQAADAHKAAQLLNKDGRYDVSTFCLPIPQQCCCTILLIRCVQAFCAGDMKFCVVA